MAKRKIKVLLTFDYEIFFGENFIDDIGVLMLPMQEIADKANKGLKFVLFVDIGYLQVLEKHNEDIFNKFIFQLNSLKNKGHELQFHYHPHWYDSYWDIEKETWAFDLTNFSYPLQVKKLGLEKANAIFDEAVVFFHKHLGDTNTYRAGALMLQPFEKELIDQLSKWNFIYDASVLPNSSVKSKELSFSFRECPLKYKWNITEESFSEKKGATINLQEVPTLSVPKQNLSLIDKMFLKLKRKFKGLKYKGNSVRRGKSIYNDTFEIDWPLTISFDYSDTSQVDYFVLLVKKYICIIGEGEPIISILNHPKSMNEDSIAAMNLFIEVVSEKYEVTIVGFNDLNPN